jgi:hypothetical protein
MNILDFVEQEKLNIGVALAKKNQFKNLAIRIPSKKYKKFWKQINKTKNGIPLSTKIVFVVSDINICLLKTQTRLQSYHPFEFFAMRSSTPKTIINAQI